MTLKVISKDSTQIAYDRLGQGPALIMVGGAFQYRSFDPRTAHLAELLAKDFTTYHYDRRGRGDSGDTQPYAKEREIEDLAAMIDEAGGSAYVFAMSSGGALALDAAANGLKITKLALYEPSFIIDNSRDSVPNDFNARITELVAADNRDEAVRDFMVTVVGVPAEMVAGMRQSPMWPGFTLVAHTIPYDGAFVGDLQRGTPLPADRWANVSIPTLVIDGGESPAWMRNAVQAVVDVLANARRLTLEGQSHDVDPEILAPILKEYFLKL